MYCVNIDFHIDFSQLYFELRIVMSYVLGLKKMSVNLTENILKIVSTFLFFYSFLHCKYAAS